MSDEGIGGLVFPPLIDFRVMVSVDAFRFIVIVEPLPPDEDAALLSSAMIMLALSFPFKGATREGVGVTLLTGAGTFFSTVAGDLSTGPLLFAVLFVVAFDAVDRIEACDTDRLVVPPGPSLVESSEGTGGFFAFAAVDNVEVAEALESLLVLCAVAVPVVFTLIFDVVDVADVLRVLDIDDTDRASLWAVLNVVDPSLLFEAEEIDLEFTGGGRNVDGPAGLCGCDEVPFLSVEARDLTDDTDGANDLGR